MPKVKLGDQIMTPRGEGTVRLIEELRTGRRYCVALDNPEAANWPANKLCCYYVNELNAQLACFGCPLFAQGHLGEWLCVAPDGLCEHPAWRRVRGMDVKPAPVQAEQLSF